MTMCLPTVNVEADNLSLQKLASIKKQIQDSTANKALVLALMCHLLRIYI